MSLRFIYGRAGSGKTSYCLNSIKKSSKYILLVPEQYSFQAQKNLLEYVGEQGTYNGQVLDFNRLAVKVFNELGGITRKHMDSTGRLMLINDILDINKPKFNALAKATRQEGFVSTIGDTISEFKKYNVTPDILSETINKIKENDSLKDKLTDINFIYTDFERRLHENYIDSDDDLTILSEIIEKSEIIMDTEIWIDEFSNFTPQQYTIIEKILLKCKSVNVSLCMGEETNTDIFEITKATENKLISMAEGNNISIDKPVFIGDQKENRFKDSREIGFLEKEFYAYPHKTYTDITKDISLFKASNTYSEIENVASQIIELVRTSKFRFNEIAVVTRDLNIYDNVVSAVFKEYEIPYFIDEKKELEGNIIIIFILSLFDIVDKNWTYESVFKFVKTGLTDLSYEEIDEIENFVLENGIRGKRKWLSTDYWKDEELIAIKDKIVKPIKSFIDKLSKESTVFDLSRSVYELLCDFKVDDKIEKLIEKFKAEENQILANEYSQIWNVIMELLDQMVEVLGNEKMSLEEYSKVISIGIAEHKMGLIPTTLDQVLIGSVDRLRSHNIKVLFLIGVNDGIIPKVTDNEGIINDKDRENLKDLGIELARDTRTMAFEEQFLIYRTLSTPSRALKISYSIADYEGKTMRPSIIIGRFKSIFTKILEKTDIIQTGSIEGELAKITSKVPTFNNLISSVRNNYDGMETNIIWKDVYSWYSRDKEWLEKCNGIFSALNYTNQVKDISEEKARILYGDKINYSVSRYEKYIQCPFAYFMEYGLRGKERKLHALTPPDLGSFMHDIIYEFSMEVTNEKIDWNEVSEDWSYETVSRIIDKKIEETGNNIFNSSERYKYLTQRIKRVINKTMLVVAQQIKAGKFKPTAFEQEFNEQSDFPPIIIELSSGEKINLIGKIDRIDMLEKDNEIYIRIIDYKSGNKVFKLSEVYYGLQVQLLLYIDAIIEFTEKKGNKVVTPGGMLYFKIDDPLIKGKGKLSEEEIETEILKTLKMKGLVLGEEEILRAMDKDIATNSLIIPAGIKSNGELSANSSAASREQFKLLREHVKKNIAINIENMLKGNIDIKPYKIKEETPCAYCLYNSVCKFDSKREDNSYRNINEKSDEEIWGMLGSECKI